VRLALAAPDDAGFAGFVSLEPRLAVAGRSGAAAGQRLRVRRQRVRLTAESTARMEALVVSASTPTPHRVRPSISHST
jgi:hypothetical protein